MSHPARFYHSAKDIIRNCRRPDRHTSCAISMWPPPAAIVILLLLPRLLPRRRGFAFAHEKSPAVSRRAKEKAVSLRVASFTYPRRIDSDWME